MNRFNFYLFGLGMLFAIALPARGLSENDDDLAALRNGQTAADYLLLQDPPDPDPEPDPDDPDPNDPDPDDPEEPEEPLGDEPTEPPVDDPETPEVQPNNRNPQRNSVRPQRPNRTRPERPNRARRTTTRTDDAKANKASGPKPRVAFEIEIEGRPIGKVVIEVDTENTPQTAENFLQYVDSGFYNNTIFHRIVQDFIVQGGGYTSLDQPKIDGLRDPIKNEAKPLMRHNRGTIAAARIERKHDSATSQFFINLDNNRKLDRRKYTVFGRVVEGMEIIERLGETPTENSDLEGKRYKTKPITAPKLTRAYRAGSTPTPSARRTQPNENPATASQADGTPADVAASRVGDDTAVDIRTANTAVGEPDLDADREIAQPNNPRIEPQDRGNPIPAPGPRNKPAQENPRDAGTPQQNTDESDEDAAVRKRLMDQIMNNPDLTDEERAEQIKSVELLLKMRKMDTGDKPKPKKPDREKISKPIENKRPKQKGSRSPG